MMMESLTAADTQLVSATQIDKSVHKVSANFSSYTIHVPNQIKCSSSCYHCGAIYICS